MVGLLVVSHSRQAADGIRDIAVQMGGEEVDIVAVGGAPDGDVGTSADDIEEGLAKLSDADGVVVLVDLGSAVMNAEHAIEAADVDATIADAPVLEGTLNAAVEATSPNATVESVVAAAEDARELSKL